VEKDEKELDENSCKEFIFFINFHVLSIFWWQFFSNGMG
jgi:uncharacterized membrane protein